MMFSKARSFYGLGAALAAVAAAGLTVVYPPLSAPRPTSEPRRRVKAMREPNGTSWRSLKRAVNSGWPAPVPSRRAMMDHAWFRKKVDAARLRIAVGQELAGDRELIGA